MLEEQVILEDSCGSLFGAQIKEENNEFVFKNSYGPNNPNHPEWIRIPTNIPPGQRTDFKII